MMRALRTISCVLPLVVAAAIWFPVARHYYVPAVRIPESSLDAFVSRPTDAALAALADLFLGFRVTEPTGLPPDSPEERLRRDGLFDVAIDLDRFEQTGDASQFPAIAERVIEFSRRANGRLAYTEFLWNDHAIANRVFVLAKFWRYYRRHPSFDAKDATEVLEHVAKNVQFLLRDDHFTYWTNHGVMQSIALLHAANAFPALPQRERMTAVALARLREQLRFFVSSSGWVMEHSAGYQEFGSSLLATLLAELDLLGEEVPADWRAKAAEAQRVLEWLARPDGSLPNFGDSDMRLADTAPASGSCERTASGARLWPEGYFVAWDTAANVGSASCAQTTVVWSSFVSNAHRRANQLSVHYWVDGVDYVLGSGYWPYGDPERPEAIGWRGSNAPHLRGEKGTDASVVRPRGACSALGFRFIDLERRNESAGSPVRRQVVDMGLGGVLLIDSSDGPADGIRESVWRIDPRVALIGPDGRAVHGSALASHAIRMTGPAVSVDELTGVYAREGQPDPTKFAAVAARDRRPAYVAASPGTEPLLIALTPADPDAEKPSYRLASFESPERWTVEDETSPLVVERRGSIIEMRDGAGESSRCEASLDAFSDDDIRAMEASFRELADRYATFNAWTLYRLKATAAVAALFLAQLGLFAFLSTALGRILRRYADPVLIAGWLGVGGYLTLVYLAQ